jgi:murein DD-endopeptidase MepM/ murein hydrolase activator NlpD
MRGRMGIRASIAALAAAAVCITGGAAAAPSAPGTGGTARAFAVKVLLPGQEAAVTANVAAPPDAVAFGAGFAYPEDGSVLTTGPVTASASASAGESTATATAASEVASLTLFGGEITVGQVVGRAAANARPGEGTGTIDGTAVVGLTVAGTPVEALPGARVTLGDWGYALVVVRGEAPTADGYRGFVTALDVHVTSDHGGLPAGSEILIGYAEAAAQAKAGPPAPITSPTTTTPPPSGESSERPPAGTKGRKGARVPPIIRRPIPSIEPRLTKGGYVFPVHGPSSFVDTFGAARAVVMWHHGEDIFAPMGAPVLAVADGTVFSVGWNDIGGNRLWLRDRQGNEFYYAHLSAFSPLAVNGAHVRGGDVLGFVGNSGDAETTPPHLHFEIHPVGLLGLGYDGVISPYRYLMAWRRLEDVRFVAGAGWVPLAVTATRAPQPGAFLLSASDISAASGLDPGSLERAMEQPASSEEGQPPGSLVAAP